MNNVIYSYKTIQQLPFLRKKLIHSFIRVTNIATKPQIKKKKMNYAVNIF